MGEFRIGPIAGVEALASHLYISHGTWVNDITNDTKRTRKEKEKELLICHATLHREPTSFDQKVTIPHYHVNRNGERIS